VSLQACGGESIDEGKDSVGVTGGTAGSSGTDTGGSSGVFGNATGGVAATSGRGTGGAAGSVAVTGGSSGAGSPSCDDVRRALDEELAAIRSCSVDSECGQALEGTSCGCTRDLVARLDADTTRFDELLRIQVDRQTCANFGSECDCPLADGFECKNNQCNWRYLDPTSCENATIGTLCVVGPDDGTLDVGDPLTIMVGANGCYSSSCTETVISRCAVQAQGENYVVGAQICLSVDTSGACTDDCGGAGSPRCESSTPLRAGTHSVTYGDFSIEFEVPSALSGARCSGFL